MEEQSNEALWYVVHTYSGYENKVANDLQSKALRDEVEKNLSLGRALGLTGTPSYVVGNRILSGAVGYDELKAEFGRLPDAGISFAPIVMPIILMAVKSIVDMAKWTGLFAQILQFLGTPMIALTVGLIISVATLFSAGKGKEFYALADETLRTVGPILFVTAAGGVLGKVISEAGIVTYITEHASFLSNVGIFFPFIIAAILKTAQGSSTVAITTTAGILGLYSAEGSLMSALGLTSPFAAALTVMAIGAGAMTVSHANDSYFWVVTNFGGMKAEDGYKTQTMCTLLMGLASIVFIWIISLFFH